MATNACDETLSRRMPAGSIENFDLTRQYFNVLSKVALCNCRLLSSGRGMNIEEFSAQFTAQLAAQTSRDDTLEVAAKTLCQGFNVNTDEVAIFLFDEKLETLNFAWPKQLRTAGFVPLSAHNSLVARTAREKKPLQDNSFACTPHTAIFEQFRLETTGKVPIQKIMSATMLSGNELKGVIQISRKGENRDAVGEDFSPGNLAALARLAAIIAAQL